MSRRREGQEPVEGSQPGAGREADAPRLVAENIARIAATARADAAFGPAHTMGERMVIPAAEVMCCMGFGMGSGEGPEGGGSGGGGGGGARSRPVAAIVVEPGGVEVHPIVDVSKIWLAALATAGFGLVWTLRLARATRETDRGAAKSLRGLIRQG